MTIARPSAAAQRGSLLIVAMILVAGIGIALASYLQLSRSSLGISNRAFYHGAAMNLAENGLEEAMYSLNRRLADAAYAWPDWTVAAGNAWAKFPRGSGPYVLGPNASGTVRVHITDHAGAAPTVVARATVELGAGERPVEKWVQIQLRTTSRFASGLVARERIVFRGTNASVDSWDADPDQNPATPAIPYSTAVRKAGGTVGSTSVAVDAVLVQNADIWGYVATGGALPTVGPQGAIGPFGTAQGTVNPQHVSTDFTANFDPVTDLPPAGLTLPAITTEISLPRAGDVALMVGGKPTYCYTTPQISLSNVKLSVRKLAPGDPNPNVIITLTNALTSVTVGGGTGQLAIAEDATLQLYAPGDVSIGGAGVLNGGDTLATANRPESFQIWGTRASTPPQGIELKGNGVLSGVVYAPFGSVTLVGNGDVLGAIVANDITITGQANIHYDESLGRSGKNTPFRVSGWRELTTAAERAAVATALGF